MRLFFYNYIEYLIGSRRLSVHDVTALTFTPVTPNRQTLVHTYKHLGLLLRLFLKATEKSNWGLKGVFIVLDAEAMLNYHQDPTIVH